MTEKERYATIGTWTEVFRQEGTPVSEAMVRKRIRMADTAGETARNIIGHVICNGFYAESAVREALSDLLQDLPQADESGTFIKDGEIYATVVSLSRLLGISERGIRSKLQKRPLSPIQGRVKTRNICDFYPLYAIRHLCKDLLKDLPQADENGVFEKNGKIYGTIRSLSRLLGISNDVIRRRLKNSSLESINAKSRAGSMRNFYLEAEIRELCADLIAKKSKK